MAQQKPIPEQHADALWQMLQTGRKLLFSDDPGSMAHRLQQEYDAGKLRGAGDVRDFLRRDRLAYASANPSDSDSRAALEALAGDSGWVERTRGQIAAIGAPPPQLPPPLPAFSGSTAAGGGSSPTMTLPPRLPPPLPVRPTPAVQSGQVESPALGGPSRRRRPPRLPSGRRHGREGLNIPQPLRFVEKATRGLVGAMAFLSPLVAPELTSSLHGLSRHMARPHEDFARRQEKLEAYQDREREKEQEENERRQKLLERATERQDRQKAKEEKAVIGKIEKDAAAEFRSIKKQVDAAGKQGSRDFQQFRRDDDAYERAEKAARRALGKTQLYKPPPEPEDLPPRQETPIEKAIRLGEEERRDKAIRDKAVRQQKTVLLPPAPPPKLPKTTLHREKPPPPPPRELLAGPRKKTPIERAIEKGEQERTTRLHRPRKSTLEMGKPQPRLEPPTPEPVRTPLPPGPGPVRPPPEATEPPEPARRRRTSLPRPDEATLPRPFPAESGPPNIDRPLPPMRVDEERLKKVFGGESPFGRAPMPEAGGAAGLLASGGGDQSSALEDFKQSVEKFVEAVKKMEGGDKEGGDDESADFAGLKKAIEEQKAALEALTSTLASLKNHKPAPGPGVSSAAAW